MRQVLLTVILSTLALTSQIVQKANANTEIINGDDLEKSENDYDLVRKLTEGQDWVKQKFKPAPEPKVVGTGGPTKPTKPQSYEDIFGNPHKPKRPKKNVEKKRQVRRRGDKDHEYEAYQAGLPGFATIDIDPKYYYEFMGAPQHLIKQGRYDEIKADEAMGDVLCKRIAYSIEREVDIKPESSHWIKDRMQCMFQVLMDENLDEVVDWLESQPYVLKLKGDSPLDAGIRKMKEDEDL